MVSMPRFIKTFSVVGKRFYPKGQPPRTERPEPGIDERVNAWVKESGNIIINATSARHTVMEKAADGTIIRKTVQLVTVIYQGEQDFMESESEMRRRALIPTAKCDDEKRPEPMSDEEELRQSTDDIMKSNPKMDGDAGGPDGMDQFFPADDEDDL